MTDSRILGQWRSDAAKTKQELAARADIPPARKKRLLQLFGKLEIRFTRSRCYFTLNGDTTSEPYEVVAKDDTSLAAVSSGKIVHIHFEGRWFWILVGTGKFREYFRRV